jgi:hypothetical protein
MQKSAYFNLVSNKQIFKTRTVFCGHLYMADFSKNLSGYLNLNPDLKFINAS